MGHTYVLACKYALIFLACNEFVKFCTGRRTRVAAGRRDWFHSVPLMDFGSFRSLALTQFFWSLIQATDLMIA